MLAWRPDGKAIAVAAGKTVTLAPLSKGAPLRLVGHESPVTALVFSYQGDRLASVDERGVARLWNAATGKPEGVLPEAGGSLAFSGDGKLLASTGGSTTIFRTGTLAKVCTTEPVSAFDVAFTADQASIVTSFVGQFTRFSASTCAREKDGSANTGGTFGSWVAPDGAHVSAAGGDGHEVQLFEARGFGGLEVLAKVDDCRDHVQVARFSRDGQMLLAEGGLRWFRSFRVASQKTVSTYDVPHPDDVTDLVMFDDGERLLVVRGAKAELVSGPSKAIAFTVDVGAATAFDVSWDMAHVAGASAHEARVWSAATGKLESTTPIPP